jgi:hypothetical protein
MAYIIIIIIISLKLPTDTHRSLPGNSQWQTVRATPVLSPPVEPFLCACFERYYGIKVSHISL